ncbi:ABC transporter ATP-binding protein [Candidatus Riflebacteria bacterium]
MIEAKNLTKNFGSLIAVNNICFKVEKGDVLGFLGPNGAGKSTAMKMLTGFLPPTSGTAIVLGMDILSDSLEIRKRIGYLAENAPLYDNLRVKGFLNFIAETRGIFGKECTEAIEKVVESCVIGEVFYKKIATLSKGFRRRVALAQALLHEPEVLILDEPTDGLDPNQKHHVRSLIKALAKRRAIILSTHILEEVDAVCNRAIIISDGEIKIDGTPDDIKARDSKNGKLEVVFRQLTEGKLS